MSAAPGRMRNPPGRCALRELFSAANSARLGDRMSTEGNLKIRKKYGEFDAKI